MNLERSWSGSGLLTKLRSACTSNLLITNYELRITNYSVIVTGGVQGIGRSSCLAFAREGATVVCADLDAMKSEKMGSWSD
ncbi:MAG: SDR family NAD(P)-dependent oxidoreductase [Stigonema ocellatum SAG 48.90 = DSM 106950]|nr:SDR family NAD(P)-dependent oxidoreductase [Stigonema ocellatum SAG 48.90 = DSM 106950]